MNLTHLIFFAEKLMTFRAKSPDLPIRDLTLQPSTAPVTPGPSNVGHTFLEQ